MTTYNFRKLALSKCPSFITWHITWSACITSKTTNRIFTPYIDETCTDNHSHENNLLLDAFSTHNLKHFSNFCWAFWNFCIAIIFYLNLLFQLTRNINRWEIQNSWNQLKLRSPTSSGKNFYHMTHKLWVITNKL